MLLASKFELVNRLSFFYKFIQSPGSIGSITPSSSFLSKKIMENLSWDSIDSIVELGAGTGVFTKHIYTRKKPSCKAIIIEKDIQLLKMLMKSYPDFYFDCEAVRLYSTLQQLEIKEVDCIVSGLPFAMFSSNLRNNILQVVDKSLKSGGIFIAFQYSLQMKTMFEHFFDKVNISLVPLNLPPAFVYFCQKAR